MNKVQANDFDTAAIAAKADLHVEDDNWVGALQSAAIASKAPPPDYAFGRDCSPDHQPAFRCRCTLGGMSAEAAGPTKRSAKRGAAKAWVELCTG